MKLGNSYVYFALKGDDFDPKTITNKIGIEPSDSWRKGEKGKYKPELEFSCWELSTEKGKEYIEIDNLVNEIVAKLFDKIEIINDIKARLELVSVLEIVLYIDTNPDISTPALGHDLKTLEFLYKTGTITDIDIYRFDSRDK
jgi:hypothetical protein